MAEKKTAPEAEEFNLEDWLEEGIQGLRRSLKGKRPQLFPDQFKQHTRAARKEMLLAVRSLLDQAVEEIEEEEPSLKKAQKIKVE
jgi:hypothetical protein